MEQLSIGINVLIKRSDGRTHDALISALNDETHSVTVEWFEKAETKGKEIDIEAIQSLNPRLFDQQQQSSPRKPQNQEPVIDPKRTVASNRRTNNVPLQSNSRQPNNFGFAKGSVRPPPPQRDQTVSNGHAMMIDDDDDDFEDENLVPPNNNMASRYSQVPGRALANKRRSHTVQEIEKLKKNRDERRARQEEMRQQKEQLKNLDPGNPNWEFLGMIREYQERLEFHPLRATDPIEDHRISVCVRKRPLNKKELNRKEIGIILKLRDTFTQTKVDLTKYLDNQKFRFDYAFDDNTNNDMVYRFTAQPLVRTIFEQGFATCFAYGQTGSGKTHTMGGDFHGKSQDCSKGIYALTAKDIFKLLNRDYRKVGLLVSCSFFEIYSGKLFDLLKNKAKLRVLEDGKKEVQVVGLQELPVINEQEVLDLIKKGTDVRTAGTTSANNHSSRSHAVFQIILRRKNNRKLHGKFSLIDLAGNERGADTNSSDRSTRMEGAEINKSLLALKECIRAMGRNNVHIPFRASKLTLVLRDSFVGENARTCMIAMISPGFNSCEHTLNTLRYADRVKELGSDDLEAGGGGGARRLPELDYPMAESPHQSDSDLALLQSRNEEELSDELYNFQLVVNHIGEAEELVLDEQQRITENMKKWVGESQRLHKMTEKVDYDLGAYAKEWRFLLSKLPMPAQEELTAAVGQVDMLLEDLKAEEIAAQKTGNRKKK